MKSYDIREIFDYLHCPLMYEMKYARKLDDLSRVDDQAGLIFTEAMHQTMYFYYSNLMQDRMPTLKQLYEKLTKVWNDGMEEQGRVDLFDEPKDTTHRSKTRRDKYLLSGYEMLAVFYRKEKGKQQKIIAVNHPYRVVLGECVIEGKFELIREVLDSETGSRFIEVVDFRTTKKKPEGFFLRHDLFATFMHYAFEKTFDGRPDRFVLDFLGQDKEVSVARDEREYRRIQRVLEGVSKTIASIDPYPRQGFHCKQCAFQKYCDIWNFD